MAEVLSFVDARAGRVKARLCTLADNRSAAMVETADSLIDARRIFCRDRMAVLIDRYGVQRRIAYGDIVDVRPIRPMSDILRLAGGQVLAIAGERMHTAEIVPFPRLRS